VAAAIAPIRLRRSLTIAETPPPAVAVIGATLKNKPAGASAVAAFDESKTASSPRPTAVCKI